MWTLFFDIDGTLIRSHGAGRQAMTLALQEMFGATGPIDAYRMDGKTDPRIITDLLSAAQDPAGTPPPGLCFCLRGSAQPAPAGPGVH